MVSLLVRSIREPALRPARLSAQVDAMKFLCSNCKAKYQIADEKVAGRTLRMTCRRCQAGDRASAASPVAMNPQLVASD